jgi:hypothetical protein
MSLPRPARLFVLACLLGLLPLAGCHHTPDEEQVRAAITAATTATGEADAGGLGDVLTDDFDGNEGRLDKRQLTGLLRLQRLRGERVSVLLGPVDVDRRGERIVATFTVTLGGGGRLLPDRLGVYRVESGWRGDDGTWRCYTATWKRAL